MDKKFDKFSGEELENLNFMQDPEMVELLIKVGMDNSYLILTGNLTAETILELAQEDEIVSFAHDPDEGFKEENLLEMLEYYEELEEYEKCSVLRDKINLKSY